MLGQNCAYRHAVLLGFPLSIRLGAQIYHMQKGLQAAGPDPLRVDALGQDDSRLLFGRA